MGFSERSTKRIISAVKRVESMPLSTEGTADSTPVATAEFWVELTAEDSTNLGRYKWKKVYPKRFNSTDHFADVDPAISSGVDYTCYCPNKTRGLKGRKALIRFSGYDTVNSKPIYLIASEAKQSLVAVRVWCNNRSTAGGSKTTQCSFAYTVKDVGQTVTLASAAVPAKPRPSYGKMITQGDTGYAVGFFTDTGTFILWDAGEVLDVGGCT